MVHVVRSDAQMLGGVIQGVRAVRFLDWVVIILGLDCSFSGVSVFLFATSLSETVTHMWLGVAPFYIEWTSMPDPHLNLQQFCRHEDFR